MRLVENIVVDVFLVVYFLEMLTLIGRVILVKINSLSDEPQLLALFSCIRYVDVCIFKFLSLDFNIYALTDIPIRVNSKPVIKSLKIILNINLFM